MKKLRWLAILASLSFQTTLAGNLPGAVTVTIADAYYHFDDKRDLDNAALPNLALAYNVSQHWAIEAAVGVMTSRQSEEMGGKEVSGSLYAIDGIYRFMPCGHFEPYLVGGIGMLTLDPNGTDTDHPGNVNVGLGAQLFWGPTIALRAEAKDIYQTTGKSRNDYLLNFGVSFLFGGNV